MKPNYIIRKVKESTHRWYVMEVHDDGEAIAAECASKRFATMIADCLNQAVLES